MDASSAKCLVTGGSGFLGRYVVEELLGEGCPAVIVFDRVDGGFDDSRVTFVKGDLTSLDSVQAAFKGVDTVFHVASLTETWGDAKLFDAVNVQGTENVLEAARREGVKRVVYTSSPSVVWNGQDIVNGDETLPIPSTHLDHYSRTKAAAEKIVIAANGEGGVATCAMRPHSMYGPRDNHFIPVLVSKAREGSTKYFIGSGENMVDVTYVENAAYAHVLAAKKLSVGSKVAGQAYFVSDDKPRSMWGFMSQVLDELEQAALPTKGLPVWLMLIVAFFMELFAKLFGGKPKLTQFIVKNASTHHYFSMAKSKKDLGYTPKVPHNEGIVRTLRYYKKKYDLRPRLNQEKYDYSGVPTFKYTRAEIAKHNTESDAWLIINDKVYDVSSYVLEHKGGASILNNAGGDSTKGFYGEQHPEGTIEDMLPDFEIGVVADL